MPAPEKISALTPQTDGALVKADALEGFKLFWNKIIEPELQVECRLLERRKIRAGRKADSQAQSEFLQAPPFCVVQQTVTDRCKYISNVCLTHHGVIFWVLSMMQISQSHALTCNTRQIVAGQPYPAGHEEEKKAAVCNAP